MTGRLVERPRLFGRRSSGAPLALGNGNAAARPAGKPPKMPRPFHETLGRCARLEFPWGRACLDGALPLLWGFAQSCGIGVDCVAGRPAGKPHEPTRPPPTRRWDGLSTGFATRKTCGGNRPKCRGRSIGRWGVTRASSFLWGRACLGGALPFLRGFRPMSGAPGSLPALFFPLERA